MGVNVRNGTPEFPYKSLLLPDCDLGRLVLDFDNSQVENK